MNPLRGTETTLAGEGDIRRYQREQSLVDPDGDESELLKMAKAAKISGITIPGVSGAIDRARFPTVVIDTEALARQSRRLLLRSGVEVLLQKREQGAIGGEEE